MPRHSSLRQAVARRPFRPCPQSQPASRTNFRQNVSSPPPQMSRKSPAKSPASQCKSSFQPSSARTSSTRRDPVHESAPSYSSARSNWNCKAKRAAHTHACEKPQQACQIAPKASHPLPAPSTTAQSHESTPNFAPLSQSRHTQPDLPASRLPPGQGCSSTSAAPLPAATPYTKSASRAQREKAPSTKSRQSWFQKSSHS